MGNRRYGRYCRIVVLPWHLACQPVKLRSSDANGWMPKLVILHSNRLSQMPLCRLLLLDSTPWCCQTASGHSIHRRIDMMKGGMGNLMKQAQKMQEQMQRAQEELAEKEVTGESGAGLVKVTMNGRHDVKRVELDDSLMEEDKDMLEELLAAAVNDAVRKVETRNQEEMSKLTAGMGLPAGMKIPF